MNYKILLCVRIFLLALVFFACQTATRESVPESLPKDCRPPAKKQPTFRTWEDSQDFSRAEENAIKSLGLVSETLQTTDGQVFELPGSRVLQEHLLNGNFRVIFPLQSIDDWNMFIVAEQFAPDSNFIRSFVLLIEGPNGWQSRFLYSSKLGRGNYLGGYDISIQNLDLNYDGRSELIFSSHQGNPGEPLNVEIFEIQYSSSRMELKRLETPKLQAYKTEFQQNYIVRVQLLDEVYPVLIRRVEMAKQIYLNYDDSGHWIGSTEAPLLYETPSRLQALSWDCEGLNYKAMYTEQRLRGVADADIIGHFVSYWALELQSPTLPQQGDDRTESYVELGWSLRSNRFEPEPGNEVLEYESLLP